MSRPSRAKDYKIQTALKVVEPRIVTDIKGIPAELPVELCKHIHLYGDPARPCNYRAYRVGVVDLRLNTFAGSHEIIWTLYGGDWEVTIYLKRDWVEYNLTHFKMVNKSGFRRDMTVIRMFGSKCGDWSNDQAY
jgi:hypothetical protein